MQSHKATFGIENPALIVQNPRFFENRTKRVGIVFAGFNAPRLPCTGFYMLIIYT